MRNFSEYFFADCDLRDTGYHQLAKVVPKTCESIVLSGNHFPSFCSALALISMCLANEKLSIIFPSRKGFVASFFFHELNFINSQFPSK